MASYLSLLLVPVLAACASAATLGESDTKQAGDDESLYRLPDGFLIGAGTSSYQTEGAWDADGKGVNVMDYAFHKIGTHAGDKACDSYNRYKEDIALAASLKLNTYRLSISWARIFPNGTVENKNEAGVQHYHDVLDELLSYKIAPLVTIYHFDHPQALEEAAGGWLSEKMVDAFAAYADFLFAEYGSKVKYWVTLNEINMHCSLLYSYGSPAGYLPPGTKETASNKNSELCIHNEILAHSAAYRIYRDKYKKTQKGMVGIGILPASFRPDTASLEDIYAAERLHMIWIGKTLYPVVYGDYPEVVKAVTKDLPEFTDQQKKELRGTADFVGFNAYVGVNISADHLGLFGPHRGHPELTRRAGMWLEHTKQATGPPAGGPPAGIQTAYWILGSLALWMDAHFGDRVKLFITENGDAFLQDGGIIDDWNTRGVSNSKFLRDLIYTINKNNLTNTIGYITWSYMDDVEFDLGVSHGGIVHVDFEGGTLARTLKRSAQVFSITMTQGAVPLIEAPVEAPSAASEAAAGSLILVLTLILSLACNWQ